MKVLRLTITLCLLLAAVPLAGQAAPQTGKGGGKPGEKVGDQPLPPHTSGSGVIDFKTLGSLQNLTILVKGPGDDATKAVKMRTTFGLTERLDELKDAKGNAIKIPEKDKTREGMLALYMNGMVSEFNRAGYKSSTRAQNIKPVPYGVIPKEDGSSELMLMGSRPAPMYYTPIRFTQPKTGETVYTFTGVVGEKLVSLRFLVAKDQQEYYENTIALILNNTWGLTMDQDAKWAREQFEKQKAAEAKAAKGKPKTN
jgi:hypothetical protein